MCGIFGLVASPQKESDIPSDEFFSQLTEVIRFDLPSAPISVPDMTDDQQVALLKRLSDTQRLSYRWVQRAGFLRLLKNEPLREQLKDAFKKVAGWTEKLEHDAAGAKLTRQRDWEFLNKLIVGGKDIAWQLEHDCLNQLARTQELLGAYASGADNRQLGHAWELHSILSSLNRLEVRGRDSAGIAVYTRFPSAGALEGFLAAGGEKRREQFTRRSACSTFRHATVLQPRTASDTLLFAFKVAREIGNMGDNYAFLRDAIMQDELFQDVLREPDVAVQCIAHTRWASNGVISEANCHPVDSSVHSQGQTGVQSAGEIVTVLNGDIDNYQELVEVYVQQHGLKIDKSTTTDAKIIPIAVHHHYNETGDLVEAFRRAFAEFEGTKAIGDMAADRPGEFVFGQKGSGQGLFFGVTSGAVTVASEMYGLVEFSQDYIKANGEVVEGGEIFHLDSRKPETVEISLVDDSGRQQLPKERRKSAEITTRDINRGDYSHFLAKEIEESVATVRKTLRGKFEVDDDGESVRSLLGDDVFPTEMLEALKSGAVRRIHVIGQGTAAVAGQGVAHLLRAALQDAQPAFEVTDMKATELSGHYLRSDMSDSLVIAISQSGTTTDTNRTVDMARERGAHVIGIVNRRNSDLVYKSHGVLYTSDGRDIEMSVASTKAFYAQNVAGHVLALALALELDTLTHADVLHEIRSLELLPEMMTRTLELQPTVRELAEKFATKRCYWAVVGSGAQKIAADEVRIKLSELCYKSIASDFLEDKKHIDLSSEPLVLVCANGIPPSTLSDVVKEVAIFKAHNSIPIVVTDEGEDRFDPYAAGTVKVPRYHGRLDYLLATMVGHLFGYYAASAFDGHADALRQLRGEVLAVAQTRNASPNQLLSSLGGEATSVLLKVDQKLQAGNLNSGLSASVASRLGTVIAFLLGRVPADSLSHQRQSFVEAILSHLTEAVSELTRPIDAIKHQAKTVTVGISRTEEPAKEGLLWETYRMLGLEPSKVVESHRRFLNAFEPLVKNVDGVSLYRVEDLDPRGRPTDRSTVQMLSKEGCATSMYSRCESPQPLSGTKWGAVKRREIYLGLGQTDGRRILILPVMTASTSGNIALYHLSLNNSVPRLVRLRAFEAHERNFERLRIAVTERNVAWKEELLDELDNETLFFSSPDAIAETLAEKAATAK